MPWMSKDGIELPAEVPTSALPHWESLGWVQCDPPEQRRPRHERRAAAAAAAVPVEQLVDEGQAEAAGQPAPLEPAAAPTPDDDPAQTDAAPAAGRKQK